MGYDVSNVGGVFELPRLVEEIRVQPIMISVRVHKLIVLGDITTTLFEVTFYFDVIIAFFSRTNGALLFEAFPNEGVTEGLGDLGRQTFEVVGRTLVDQCVTFTPVVGGEKVLGRQLGEGG